ncbi:MAG: PIG-L family deacetylase [Planctomycetes bacterium]|nr:PIG-L family deacetylase [Planctomycetota bacterium]
MSAPHAAHDATTRLPAPRLLATPPRGRVLCFAPHPDDEVIGPGGTLALHARAGDPVRVVIATDGASGDPDGRFPRAEYAARRRAESVAGLAVLGVPAPICWGYPDACVLTEADLAGIAERAGAELAAWPADVVYLPWSGEHNADHRALHDGVARALRRHAFRGVALGYEVWSPLEPELLIDIEPCVALKRRAIGCYETQLRYVDYAHVILGLNAYRSLHCGGGRGHAEAFCLVATT